MTARLLSIVFALLTTIWSVGSALAWSLKTHLWIAQQVIDDVVDDCKVTLKLRDGRALPYNVPPEVCAAIKAHPQMYRAGHLGPDIFPDPVSGQMTTHPGIENGWSTERWLRQVVEKADGHDELAIAYGFLGHAAGDIFAHTYVNQYAGDIFVLTDGETQTELRHFALEKYIESKTPPLPFSIDAGGVKVPAKYLSQQLIHNGDAARQYRKVPAAMHLASLNAAKEAVDGLSGTSRKITDKLIDFYADYYKLQLREIAKIATFEHEVEAAKAALRAAELSLELERKALELARKAIDEAQEIIEKNPEIINALTGQISTTLNLISEASGAVGKLSQAKQQAVDRLNNAQQQMVGLVCNVQKQVCGEVTDRICKFIPFASPICNEVKKTVCEIVVESQPQCGPVQAAIDQAIAAVNKVTSEFEQAVANHAQLLARKAALEAEKVEREVKLAAARAAIDGLRLALDTHQKVNEAKGKAVDEARKAVEFAEEQLKEVRKAAEPIFKLVDKIAGVMKDYNSLSLFFKNWKDGIERAGEDFIDASMLTGFTMINEDGKGIEHYKHWLQCSALNYLGVPWQLPFALCEVKDKVTEIREKIDEFKDSLPPVVQWLIDPLGELKQEATKVAKKEVWKAAKDAADFVMGPPTGRFIGMLASQEKATADAVRGIFRDPGNTGGKKVLVFDDVIKLVDEDIGLAGGLLNPDTFHALRNAVTLSKLSLLDAAELNRLYQDIAGDLPTRYGPTLYGDQIGKRFSLLFYAVRSIDGNHQWQPFGLPYLRADKAHGPKDPNLRRYGHSVHDHAFDGFRLFQDPIGREKVFLQLFTGPVEASMAKIPQAQTPDYSHPACERNPFPRTVDDFGGIIQVDTGCSGVPVAKGGPQAPKAKITAHTPDQKIAGSRQARAKRKVRVVSCGWQGFGSGMPNGVRVNVVAYKPAAIRDFARHRHQCSWGTFGGGDVLAAVWWHWQSAEGAPRAAPGRKVARNVAKQGRMRVAPSRRQSFGFADTLTKERLMR